MGKYDNEIQNGSGHWHREIPNSDIQRCIANELAEMNRLKRLELGIIDDISPPRKKLDPTKTTIREDGRG